MGLQSFIVYYWNWPTTPISPSPLVCRRWTSFFLRLLSHKPSDVAIKPQNILYWAGNVHSLLHQITAAENLSRIWFGKLIVEVKGQDVAAELASLLNPAAAASWQTRREEDVYTAASNFSCSFARLSKTEEAAARSTNWTLRKGTELMRADLRIKIYLSHIFVRI